MHKGSRFSQHFGKVAFRNAKANLLMMFLVFYDKLEFEGPKRYWLQLPAKTSICHLLEKCRSG